MTEALEALKQALKALRANGMPLILLRERSFDAKTAVEPGDYDFLLPDEAFEEALEVWHLKIMETKTSCHVAFNKPEKRSVTLFGPKSKETIQLDFWREQRIDVPRGGRRDTRVLRYSSLLPHTSAADDVLRIAPWLEFVIYCAHLFEKKKDLGAAGVKERLRRYGSTDFSASACPPELSRELAGMCERLLGGSMETQSAAAASTRILESLGLIAAKPSRGERARWWLKRRARSLARRLGAPPVAVVQGPDGSGKTAIIQSALEAAERGSAKIARPLEPVVFKRLYRHSLFRPLYKTVRKLRRLRDREEPKEVVEAALSPFLFLGALLNYRLKQLFGRRKKIYLFDRFFSDLLVTNRKDPAATLEFSGSYPVLKRLAPAVDCVALLVANSEVLQGRKGEMSEGNALRYTQLMAAHYTKDPPWNLLLLRTDIPIERSVDIFLQLIERIGAR